MSRIILSKLDYARIQKLFDNSAFLKTISPAESKSLMKELDSATVVDPHEIPSDVVTMNSVVKITFLNTQKQLELKIVYPDQADMMQNKISIFSPIATALIGYKAGDTIEWIVPAGITSIHIDEIIYQPEAAGDFEL
jgi:regulator of nucleoside diphosphate kinase